MRSYQASLRKCRGAGLALPEEMERERERSVKLGLVLKTKGMQETIFIVKLELLERSCKKGPIPSNLVLS